MRKRIFLIAYFVFLWTSGTCFASQAPHQVSVFVLNRNISDFKDYVIMETALPIRYMENIKEVEIKKIEGFKTGLIAYTTCADPGNIVRIKLKYIDSSKKFFENLLEQFKKKFGKPKEYRGDPFHILIAWKWSFIDSDDNRISLILQHNSQDSEEKLGNAVKLTMTNLMEEDRHCYNKKATDDRAKMQRKDWKTIKPGLSGWNNYVPQ